MDDSPYLIELGMIWNTLQLVDFFFKKHHIWGVRCLGQLIQLSHKILWVGRWSQTTLTKMCKSNSRTKNWMWTLPGTCTNDHHLRLRYADQNLVVAPNRSSIMVRDFRYPNRFVHLSLPFAPANGGASSVLIWSTKLQQRPMILHFFGTKKQWDSWKKIASFEIERQIYKKSCISMTQIKVYAKIQKEFCIEKTHQPFHFSPSSSKQTATPFVHFVHLVPAAKRLWITEGLGDLCRPSVFFRCSRRNCHSSLPREVTVSRFVSLLF